MKPKKFSWAIPDKLTFLKQLLVVTLLVKIFILFDIIFRIRGLFLSGSFLNACWIHQTHCCCLSSFHWVSFHSFLSFTGTTRASETPRSPSEDKNILWAGTTRTQIANITSHFVIGQRRSVSAFERWKWLNRCFPIFKQWSSCQSESWLIRPSCWSPFWATPVCAGLKMFLLNWTTTTDQKIKRLNAASGSVGRSAFELWIFSRSLGAVGAVLTQLAHQSQLQTISWWSRTFQAVPGRLNQH